MHATISALKNKNDLSLEAAQEDILWMDFSHVKL